MEPTLRHDWTLEEALALYQRPFADLLFAAMSTHRACFDPNAVQLSTLLNIKAGGCPEDCGYCPQSAHHQAQVPATALLGVAEVLAAARRAKAAGATRFCMGAAWRGPNGRQLTKVAEMVGAVKALGMETCVTLGMLDAAQAEELKAAGLDYYNHNLDTAPEHYPEIVTTRGYADRLNTLGHLREAGLKVCAGGIVGMGESVAGRCGLLVALANLPEHPESVPINRLVRVPGTPLAEAPDLDPLDPLDLVRTIAIARLLMPRSVVRLSAGRADLSAAEQALCFLAGANSLFYGEELLTTPNCGVDADRSLFARLGLHPQA